MRSTFSSQVKDDRVTVAEGTFDSTGVDQGWADLVVIAQVCSYGPHPLSIQLILSQAYHWCPDYEAASAEFSRILKSNGSVAYVWNLEDKFVIDLGFFELFSLFPNFFTGMRRDGSTKLEIQ